MKLKPTLAALMLTCLGVGAVVAADEPQVVRQEMMKKVGGAMGAMGAMAKGEKPYDAEVVKASLTTIADIAKVFPDHFPDGTETGLDTEASPKIWENRADFKAKADALGAAATAQLASVPVDVAGLGPVIKAVGGTCGDCHETYRLKK